MAKYRPGDRSKLAIFETLLDKAISNIVGRSNRAKIREIGVPRRPAKARRQAFALEAIEPRLLLSADPLGTIATGVLTANLSNNSDAVVITQVGSATDGGAIVDLSVNGLTERYGSSDS